MRLPKFQGTIRGKDGFLHSLQCGWPRVLGQQFWNELSNQFPKTAVQAPRGQAIKIVSATSKQSTNLDWRAPSNRRWLFWRMDSGHGGCKIGNRVIPFRNPVQSLAFPIQICQVQLMRDRFLNNLSKFRWLELFRMFQTLFYWFINFNTPLLFYKNIPGMGTLGYNLVHLYNW